MEHSDSKARGCNGETGRSASRLCCNSAQMCAVIDNLQEGVMMKWSFLILLFSQNTVQIVSGNYCLHPTLIS